MNMTQYDPSSANRNLGSLTFIDLSFFSQDLCILCFCQKQTYSVYWNSSSGWPWDNATKQLVITWSDFLKKKKSAEASRWFCQGLFSVTQIGQNMQMQSFSWPIRNMKNAWGWASTYVTVEGEVRKGCCLRLQKIYRHQRWWNHLFFCTLIIYIDNEKPMTVEANVTQAKTSHHSWKMI